MDPFYLPLMIDEREMEEVCNDIWQGKYEVFGEKLHPAHY
jgi:hypothetical protein